MLINNGKSISSFISYPQNTNANVDFSIGISDIYDWNTSSFVVPLTSNNTFENNLLGLPS